MLFLFTIPVQAFTVGVVGAHGGLGRELIQQCNERGWNSLAMVRRSALVEAPVRTGWLNPSSESKEYLPTNYFLTKGSDTMCPEQCDAIVFAMSGKPFENNTSTTDVIRAVCDSLTPRCKSMCLVSAYGVGDSIEGANVGIQVMRSWYLKSTYDEKLKQEELVDSLPIRSLILRPKVLSFDTIPFNPTAVRRRDLAMDILDWISSEKN